MGPRCSLCLRRSEARNSVSDSRFPQNGFKRFAEVKENDHERIINSAIP